MNNFYIRKNRQSLDKTPSAKYVYNALVGKGEAWRKLIKQRRANKGLLTFLLLSSIFFSRADGLYVRHVHSSTYNKPCRAWDSVSLSMRYTACHTVLGKMNSWYLGKNRFCFFFGKAMVWLPFKILSYFIDKQKEPIAIGSL